MFPSVSRKLVLYGAQWLTLLLLLVVIALSSFFGQLVLNTPWKQWNAASEQLNELWSLHNGAQLIGKSTSGKYFVCVRSTLSCDNLFYSPDPYYAPDMSTAQSSRGEQCDYARGNQSLQNGPAEIVSCTFLGFGDQLASGAGITTVLDVNGDVWSWQHTPFDVARSNAIRCMFLPMLILGSVVLIPVTFVLARLMRW